MRILTTAALLLGTLAASAQTAPPTDSALVSQGWQLLLERNDHQYWLWDEDMEWEPARAMCESLGAYLYWPNDAEEHQAVWETMQHGNDGIQYWTSIHQDFETTNCQDSGNNGSWVGADGSVQSFLVWPSNNSQPDNAAQSESVVQIEWGNLGMAMNDAPGQVGCDDYYAQICPCTFSRVILERSTPTFCDDPSACNYIEGSLTNDGCDYSCCPGPGCCAEGMHWDWELGQCQNTLPGDTNGDGCVQLNDLLDVLSAYGNCAQAFTCGNPVSYQGYDYATVQIGDQCWFAENLRSENYANGDAIPANLSDSGWSSTTSGAVAIYGEGDVCNNFSPDIDSCDPSQSLNEYGRLYNGYAVEDSRGLCPSDWHIPTDGDWSELTFELGGESTAGQQLKSDYGWNGGENGTNSSGFSGLPGGYRHINGAFDYTGYGGSWWGPALGAVNWYRTLYYNNEAIFINYSSDQRSGFSVRCVQDAD